MASDQPLSEKKILEASLDSLGMWLLGWTAVITVGLVIEYGPEIAQAVQRHQLPSGPLIGGLLVTLGVAGELFVSFKASRRENKLRTVNDSIIARERNARLEMLAQLEPRNFTKEEMDCFVKALRDGGIAELNIFSHADLEASAYCAMIMHGLQVAGVSIQKYYVGLSEFPTGVSQWGLTLYEYPQSVCLQNVRRAFFCVSKPCQGYTPSQALPQIPVPNLADPVPVPSPSLFVGMKLPPFATLPDYLKTREYRELFERWDPPS